jgi:CO/xanthine dehydrogenase FAD-binding subunit
LAGAAATPNADRRGGVDYKKEMTRVLTVRALRNAVARASGGK